MEERGEYVGREIKAKNQSPIPTAYDPYAHNAGDVFDASVEEGIRGSSGNNRASKKFYSGGLSSGNPIFKNFLKKGNKVEHERGIDEGDMED